MLARFASASAVVFARLRLKTGEVRAERIAKPVGKGNVAVLEEECSKYRTP